MTVKTEESKINRARRLNLKKLMEEHGGPNALASTLGYAGGSFLVQMAGPNPVREITEKTVRKFEEKLGLEVGHLDREPDVSPPPAIIVKKAPAPPAAPVPTDITLVLDVIRLVGQVCEETKLTLPPMKFADVVALAYSDAAETGGKPRESHLRQVIKLMQR